jgi:hypothetical protein
VLVACTLAAPAAASPWVDYALHCRGCHLEHGEGAPPAVPSLREVSKLLAAPGGREYLVRVPGVAHAPLDDAALAELLDWVLREMGGPLPAGYAPYTAEEVRRARVHPLIDPAAARRALERDGAP